MPDQAGRLIATAARGSGGRRTHPAPRSRPAARTTAVTDAVGPRRRPHRPSSCATSSSASRASSPTTASNLTRDAGHHPRHRRRERRRQVDADEDRSTAPTGPTRARIVVNGVEQHFRRPRDAIARRHRHGVPALHAGRQPHRLGEHRARRRARARGCGSTSARPAGGSASSAAATASTSTPTSWSAELGVGERQRVEILKVLYRGARIIILDEPTAVLVPQEVDELFASLRELVGQGRHGHLHLPQARRGAAAWPTPSPSSGPARTVAEVDCRSDGDRPPAGRADGGQRAAHARDPRVDRRPSRSRSRVSDLTVTGEDGRAAARRRLVHRPPGRDPRRRRRRGQRPDRADRGHHRAPSRSDAGIGRAARAATSPRSARGSGASAGIGYIPQDRQRDGLVLDAPLWENVMLGHQTQPPFARGLWIDRGRRRSHGPRRSSSEFDVRTPGPDVAAAGAVGRQPAEAHRRPGDDGRPEGAHRRPPDTRASTSAPRPPSGTTCARPGAAAWPSLLVSADLEELIGLSDTLLVIVRAASIVATLDPATVTPGGARLVHDRRQRDGRCAA